MKTFAQTNNILKKYKNYMLNLSDLDIANLRAMKQELEESIKTNKAQLKTDAALEDTEKLQRVNEVITEKMNSFGQMLKS